MSTVPPKPKRGIRTLTRVCRGHCLDQRLRPAMLSGELPPANLETAFMEPHAHLLTAHDYTLREGLTRVWVVDQAEVLSELMVLPLLQIHWRADVGH